MSSLGFSQINNNDSNKKSDNTQKDYQQYMNGRVIIEGPPMAAFELFQGENQETARSYRNTTLESTMETNQVSQMFFSSGNKEFLQKKIIEEVFVKSDRKYSIGKQSDIHLLIIMRSIYVQYGRNLFCDIKKQVGELNQMVVNDCVGRILSEINQRQVYNDFVSHLPQQLPNPKNPSIKGDKILYSKIG